MSVTMKRDRATASSGSTPNQNELRAKRRRVEIGTQTDHEFPKTMQISYGRMAITQNAWFKLQQKKDWLPPQEFIQKPCLPPETRVLNLAVTTSGQSSKPSQSERQSDLAPKLGPVLESTDLTLQKNTDGNDGAPRNNQPKLVSATHKILYENAITRVTASINSTDEAIRKIRDLLAEIDNDSDAKKQENSQIKRKDEDISIREVKTLPPGPQELKTKEWEDLHTKEDDSFEPGTPARGILESSCFMTPTSPDDVISKGPIHGQQLQVSGIEALLENTIVGLNPLCSSTPAQEGLLKKKDLCRRIIWFEDNPAKENFAPVNIHPDGVFPAWNLLAEVSQPVICTNDGRPSASSGEVLHASASHEANNAMKVSNCGETFLLVGKNPMEITGESGFQANKDNLISPANRNIPSVADAIKERLNILFPDVHNHSSQYDTKHESAFEAISTKEDKFGVEHLSSREHCLEIENLQNSQEGNHQISTPFLPVLEDIVKSSSLLPSHEQDKVDNSKLPFKPDENCIEKSLCVETTKSRSQTDHRFKRIEELQAKMSAITERLNESVKKAQEIANKCAKVPNEKMFVSPPSERKRKYPFLHDDVFWNAKRRPKGGLNASSLEEKNFGDFMGSETTINERKTKDFPAIQFTSDFPIKQRPTNFQIMIETIAKMNPERAKDSSAKAGIDQSTSAETIILD